MASEAAVMMEPAIEPAAYDLREFCRVHSIGKTYAYQQIREGRLVARKAGKKTLIMREAAIAWRANLPTIRPQEK
jgi:hypothetical protein